MPEKHILLALHMAKIVKGIHAVMRTTKNEWKQNYTALTKKLNKKNARQIMPNTAQQNTATTERKKHQINTNKSQQKKSMCIRITSRCLSTTKSTFTTKEKKNRLRPAGHHSTQHAQQQAHSTTRLWCSSSPSTRAGLGCATCLLYTSPSPRDHPSSRMPSSA